MSKKVLVILADGFEEVEALSPIDVLRRSGATVTLAALEYAAGTKSVRGAHDVYVGCDALLADVGSQAFDAIVLPGGMPGAKNLHESTAVTKVILDTFGRGDLICAICASPAYVLAPTGVLKGKKATCYPGCEKVAPGVEFTGERVVKDGNVITSAGPGTALEFGLKISQTLFGDQMSSSLKAGMLVR